jgi:hypothetical protein
MDRVPLNLQSARKDPGITGFHFMLGKSFLSAWLVMVLASCSSSQNSSTAGQASLEPVTGEVPANVIEVQGLSAGPFKPTEWQNNTLNWVPDVRVPVLAPLPGPNQDIYSPWALEQPNGWRVFYGGWDGSDTPNDRVYSVTTSDFLSFDNRILVIDHGIFQHVDNVNVHQTPDGSLHMICTALPDPQGLDKPAYFSSPDGLTWNGSVEPYSAQLSDLVSIPNDFYYENTDYNGGNVLLWDSGEWILYYSSGGYASHSGVFRATTLNPPVFEYTGEVLASPSYSNDVRMFQSGGQIWYLMALYVESVTHVPPPTFTYSFSNDGVTFQPEQPLFAGAYPQDQYLTTPSFVTRGSQILGVLYGGNPSDLDSPTDQIFARWLQKKIVIMDSAGVRYAAQGGYGPDRQWFLPSASGIIDGTIIVYAEDGVTQLATGKVNIHAGQAYRLVVKDLFL